MKLNDAWKGLTSTAKTRWKTEILLLAQQQELSCSESYLRQLMSGNRKAPCGPELAELVSDYFTGKGIDVSKADVLGTVKD